MRVQLGKPSEYLNMNKGKQYKDQYEGRVELDSQIKNILM